MSLFYALAFCIFHILVGAVHVAVKVANALLAERGEVLLLLPLAAQLMQRLLKLRALLLKAYAFGIYPFFLSSSQFQPIIPSLVYLIKHPFVSRV